MESCYFLKVVYRNFDLVCSKGWDLTISHFQRLATRPYICLKSSMTKAEGYW
jgi:hypothetical protein